MSITETDNDNTESILQSIVNTLAEVLEHFLTAKELKRIESMFSNSGSLDDILSNILTMASQIKRNVAKHNAKDYASEMNTAKSTEDQNYLNLERMVQKYEAEIRNHIKIEQQLNIYTQGLEDEIEMFRSEVSSLKNDKISLEEKLRNIAKHESKLLKSEGITRNSSIDQVN